MAIGSLAVRVSANTRPYERGMRGTRKPANDLRNRMNQVAKRAGAMSTAMAGAGAAITTHLVNRGLDAVDAQAKLARQLGTTQETVAGLTRAAKDAGIEQSQLESNVQALNKRLGEAQEGSGRAADTLDKLGLSAQELAEMPLDERMDTIGSAINNLDTQTEKAAATADLFSRSGLDMMNVFAQGEGAIQKATEEARDFGIAVTQVDAAKVEAANDAMSRVGDVVQGVSNQLAVELAPILQGVSELFTDAAKEGGGIGDSVSEAVEQATSAFGFVADSVEGIKRSFQVLGRVAALAFLGIQQGALEAADYIVNWPTRAANDLIGLLNKIPGMDISAEMGMSSWGKDINDRLQTVRGAVAEGIQDIHNILMEPMPSDVIDEWVHQQREATDEAANNAERARERIDNALGSSSGDGEDGEDGGESGDSELAEEQRRAMQRRLEYLTEGLATERQVKQKNFEQEMERLREQNGMMLLADEEFRQRQRDLEVQHWAQMAGIRDSSLNAMADMVGKAYGKEAGMVSAAMQDMLASTSKSSKKAFEIQKDVATANAIISGKEAAVNAWNAGMSVGGPAAPAVAASFMAASLAKTGAEIKAIRSQSFKGGSGGSTGAGGAGGVPTTGGGAVPGTGGGAEQGGGRTVNPTFNIQGDAISTRQFRELIDGLNETLDDGAELGTVRVAS